MPSRRTLSAAAGYTALAAIDSVLAGRTSTAARRARVFTKPLLMPALATAFRESTRGDSHMLTRSTAAAQAFSWGGDVALLGKGQPAFLTGVGSFAAAHAAYITGFASRRASSGDLETGGIKAAAAVWATATPVIGLAARRKAPELALPVAGYATILAAMFATSTTLDPAIRPRSRNLVKAGTTLFLLSDSLLGAQKFLLKQHNPVLESAVMATYTAGQGLIAAGVATGVADAGRVSR